MRKLGAVIHKELLLLLRDRAGLLVLFLMPAVLVVVVSLVQENVLKATGGAAVRVLYVDRDGAEAGRMIREQLARSDAVELVVDQEGSGDEAIRDLLTGGAYQFCLVVPEGLSRDLAARVRRQVAAAFNPPAEGENAGAAGGEDQPGIELPALTVYFDPLVQGAFRAAVLNALEGTLLAMEMEMKARVFSEAVPVQAERIMQLFMGPGYVPGTFPRIAPDWGRQRLVAIRSRRASRAGLEHLPSAAQQNVPAWALFGMFFIVVPMGGSLIRERKEGTLKRLMSLPVPYALVLLGKVIAYMLICMGQFLLVLMIGRYLLPHLGSAPLTIGSGYGAVLLVVVSAALAAAGYSILVGTVARTYEQASMFGAVSVVIAAALGGVMVPVYAMPQAMQEISRLSPLAWGLNALTALFVREGNLETVLPEICRLVAFAAGATLIGWMVFRRRLSREP